MEYWLSLIFCILAYTTACLLFVYRAMPIPCAWGFAFISLMFAFSAGSAHGKALRKSR
jgi:hypothetical protein